MRRQELSSKITKLKEMLNFCGLRSVYQEGQRDGSHSGKLQRQDERNADPEFGFLCFGGGYSAW